MTFAWYGQLKYPGIVGRGAGELGIAFFEYCFAVPANRIGYAVYFPPQLKTMQGLPGSGRIFRLP
jgi:uncharacterized protein (DUF486 family)